MQHRPQVRDPPDLPDAIPSGVIVKHLPVQGLVRGCLTVLLVLLRRASSTCRRRLALGGSDTPAHAIQSQCNSKFRSFTLRSATIPQKYQFSWILPECLGDQIQPPFICCVSRRYAARENEVHADPGSCVDEFAVSFHLLPSMAAILRLSPEEGSADGGVLRSKVVEVLVSPGRFCYMVVSSSS